MPVTKKKISEGKYKGKYRVSTPGGVKAKHTTKKNAEDQEQLLNAIEHNPDFVPRASKKAARHGRGRRIRKQVRT